MHHDAWTLFVAAVMHISSLMLANSVCAEQLAPGDRVRVEYDGGRVEGSIFSSNSQSIIVATDDIASPVTIQNESITMMQKQKGTHLHTGEGLFIGAGAGLIAGIIRRFHDEQNDSMGAGRLGIAGCALLGAMSGVVIGTMVRTDRWVNVPAGSVGVGLDPITRQPSLRLTWNF